MGLITMHVAITAICRPKTLHESLSSFKENVIDPNIDDFNFEAVVHVDRIPRESTVEDQQKVLDVVEQLLMKVDM